MVANLLPLVSKKNRCPGCHGFFSGLCNLATTNQYNFGIETKEHELRIFGEVTTSV
jgi:hypothetical protein